MESNSVIECSIDSANRFRTTKNAPSQYDLDSNNNVGAKISNKTFTPNNEQTTSSTNSSSKFCSTFQNSVFSSTARKLTIKADNIMRLLRQISLDSGILQRNPSSSSSTTPQSPLSPSASSTSKTNSDQNNGDKLSSTFMRHLCHTIDHIHILLSSVESSPKSPKTASNGASPFKLSSSKTLSTERRSDILKAFEDFNSLIVQLIQLSDSNKKLKSPLKKSKSSKIKRQYSAFFEGGNRFRKKSLSRRASELNLTTAVNGNGGSNNNHNNNNINSHNGSNEFSDDQHQSNNGHHNCNELEEAVQRIISSKILRVLLDSIPSLEFEEKKMVRIILTNALILEVNKVHLIVDYFCDPSSQMLENLIHSYEIGRSDVTLNCGRILRFSSQYRSIVTTILDSDYLYDFFQYMQRSPTNFPFDVAMDVFYTFKNILTRHKTITTNVLIRNPDQFFASFIGLLAHADQTENYVTKRQSLEIFADIFSGTSASCNEFRRKFITQPQFIFPVILYLWNRNLQIRLRCLVLLNQLFSFTKIASADDVDIDKSTNEQVRKMDLLNPNNISPTAKGNTATTTNNNRNNNESNHNNNHNNTNNKDCDSPGSTSEKSPPSSPTSKKSPKKATEPQIEWQIELLICQIELVQAKYSAEDETIQCDLVAMFAELKAECKKSNIKLFMSQIPFVDRIIDTLCASKTKPDELPLETL